MKKLKWKVRGVIAVVLVAGIMAGSFWIQRKNDNSKPVIPVENHDVTLENEGILDFTVADFQEAILGESKKLTQLIVKEQEISVDTTITDAGLFNWGVFNKTQDVTIYGTGQYTVDLGLIQPNDIHLDRTNYILTIRIPHAVLHQVTMKPEKTVIGETERGWLAFGEIELNQEQQKVFQSEAEKKLQEKLNEAEPLEKADECAKQVACDIFQKAVGTISPACKVVVEI